MPLFILQYAYKLLYACQKNVVFSEEYAKLLIRCKLCVITMLWHEPKDREPTQNIEHIA
jgi:hypothetical protein